MEYRRRERRRRLHLPDAQRLPSGCGGPERASMCGWDQSYTVRSERLSHLSALFLPPQTWHVNVKTVENKRNTTQKERRAQKCVRACVRACAGGRIPTERLVLHSFCGVLFASERLSWSCGPAGGAADSAPSRPSRANFPTAVSRSCGSFWVSLVVFDAAAVHPNRTTLKTVSHLNVASSASFKWQMRLPQNQSIKSNKSGTIKSHKSRVAASEAIRQSGNVFGLRSFGAETRCRFVTVKVGPRAAFGSRFSLSRLVFRRFETVRSRLRVFASPFARRRPDARACFFFGPGLAGRAPCLSHSGFLHVCVHVRVHLGWDFEAVCTNVAPQMEKF